MKKKTPAFPKKDHHYKAYWNEITELPWEWNHLFTYGWTADENTWTEPNGVERLEKLIKYKGQDFVIAKQRGFISKDNKVVPLVYKMDSHGFRVFDNHKEKESIAVLGCSDTFGVGLFKEQTWAFNLGLKTEKPVWNFGIPGASMHLNYEVLLNHLDGKNITDLFWLIPDCRRTNLVIFNQESKCYERLQVGANRVPRTIKKTKLASEDQNFTTLDYFDSLRVSETKVYVDQMMIIDAVENLCRNRNITLHQVLNPFYLNHKVIQEHLRTNNRYLKVDRYEKAYDDSHLGVPFHEQVTEYFYHMFKNKQ